MQKTTHKSPGSDRGLDTCCAMLPGLGEYCVLCSSFLQLETMITGFHTWYVLFLGLIHEGMCTKRPLFDISPRCFCFDIQHSLRIHTTNRARTQGASCKLGSSHAVLIQRLGGKECAPSQRDWNRSSQRKYYSRPATESSITARPSSALESNTRRYVFFSCQTLRYESTSYTRIDTEDREAQSKQ